MPTAALICYHKNLHQLYPPAWIDQYRSSILNQTNRNFDIYELNYGGGQERIFEQSKFISYPFPTFADGMNYLLDALLGTPGKGYDCVFNTNVDDYYQHDRIEKQLPYIEQGYDIVSSNFIELQNEAAVKITDFHLLNIQGELNSENNIVAHPSVVFSRRFWMDGRNRYLAQEIPYEDLKLWQRSIPFYRFVILQKPLLIHRIHNNSVCKNTTSR